MEKLQSACNGNQKNCEPNNLGCRPKQRQAILQWAYDPFI